MDAAWSVSRCERLTNLSIYTYSSSVSGSISPSAPESMAIKPTHTSSRTTSDLEGRRVRFSILGHAFFVFLFFSSFLFCCLFSFPFSFVSFFFVRTHFWFLQLKVHE